MTTRKGLIMFLSVCVGFGLGWVSATVWFTERTVTPPEHGPVQAGPGNFGNSCLPQGRAHLVFGNHGAGYSNPQGKRTWFLSLTNQQNMAISTTQYAAGFNDIYGNFNCLEKANNFEYSHKFSSDECLCFTIEITSGSLQVGDQVTIGLRWQ